MPDIWTKHPDIVKEGISAVGGRCGGEPRILKPRDPQWTCYLDSADVMRDIYIHPYDDLPAAKFPYAESSLGVLAGLFFGYLLGGRRRQRS